MKAHSLAFVAFIFKEHNIKRELKMKERITITLDSELIRQIDKRIDGSIIKNRSQQIELLLTKSLGTYRPEKAIILVGGKGTRLRPMTLKTPKCMMEIQGRTVIEHLFDLLKKYGIRDVILSVGHMKEKVKDYYEDGSKFGVNITYVEEDEPLGTGGPLRLAKEHLKDSFIVTNGDELKSLNIPRMFRLHKRKDALATIALTTVTDPTQYGVARLSGSRILEFVEKPKLGEAPSTLINAGFYILEPEIIDMIPPGFSMLEKDVFPKLAKQGRLRGFPIAGQWFDIGNIERYEIAKKKWNGVKIYEEND
ncbi:MAG: NTP transferase domain-containing protein [Nanoarchaeota archaeon]|nr:NTP transferase domain-containing protein [Nanoarchaeota archaeon]